MRKTYGQLLHDKYELLRARLVDCYSRSRILHRTHEAHLEDVKARVWDTAEFKRLPQYYQAMLRECMRCLSDAQWQHLAWRLGPAEGPLPGEGPSGHEWGEGSQLSQLARTKGALYGSHFWAGTDKIFGKWEPIN